jgi:MinD-like ATPase involved in chromosome partitioning or flagellar assembly
VVSFDDVLDVLVQTCEEHPGFDDVEAAAAVRDLEGRIRLALGLTGGGSPPLDVGALTAALKVALGDWLVAPILVKGKSAGRTREGRELAQLASQVLDRAEPWKDAGWDEIGTNARRTPVQGRWRIVEARLSKQAWTGGKVTLPWPLHAGSPAIATFHSFKGGVGRTTLLAAMAWRLAARGKHVVVIDLDVEAPGVSTLLGAQSRKGLLDVLLDHVATGKLDLDTALSRPTELDADCQGRVEVLGTGPLDARYFEKLARLDFSVSGVLPKEAHSPVEAGLRAILQALVQRTPRPEYILLDARAGLHDVAGLGLHGLAHVDVLVARASEQAYQGLDLTIQSIARRRRRKDQRLLVAHTFVPVKGTPEARRVEDEFADRIYQVFERHVHPAMDPLDRPAPEAAGAHQPTIVRRALELETPAHLSVLRDLMLGDHFADAFERFEVLCKPEPK